MKEQEWVEQIALIDPKIKFVRLNDSVIGNHQDNGRLQVLMVYSRGDNRGKYYYCQCDCGKTTTVWGAHFRNGHSKSCGCWHDESGRVQMKKLNATNYRYRGHDISGTILNSFQVLEKIGQNNNLEWVYKCICPQCSEECYKTERGMRETLSCGCVRLSKGEQKIIELLKDAGIKFQKEKTFKDCVDKGRLRFDFYVNEQYLIEFDGEQHYKDSKFFSNTQNLKEIQKKDAIKNSWCKEHNILLIRIPYTHLKKLCIEDLILETSTFII